MLFAPILATNSIVAPLPTFTVTLRPVRSGKPEVTKIEVREVVDMPSVPNDNFQLIAAITAAGVTGIAERIQDMEVRDTSGIVPLEVKDDPAVPRGMLYFRHWQAKRSVRYPVVITYSSLPQPTPAQRGPQISFRAHSGGISASGLGFLAIPEGDRIFHTRFRWDLSELDHKSTGATSFGDGDLEMDSSPWQLIEAFYMAGPMGRYANKVEGDLAGYWLGKPPFDAKKEMAWISDCYSYQKRFFAGASEPIRPTYRVFLRALPNAPNFMGGTALGASFLLGIGAENTQVLPSLVDVERTTTAHEMMHMFIGSGKDEGAGPWFTEGLTEYYTKLLLLRSGLISVDRYIQDINRCCDSYYTNPYRNKSPNELEQLGFDTGIERGSAQNVAYTRGRLYFALVDAKIRAASGGRRKLDDVILPLLKQRDLSRTVSIPLLVQAFESAYGTQARKDFESIILRGETIELPVGMLGLGFKRVAKKYGAGGTKVDGYNWTRNQGVPDAQVREW